MPRLSVALALGCAAAAVAGAGATTYSRPGESDYFSDRRRGQKIQRGYDYTNDALDRKEEADRADTERDAKEMTLHARLHGCNLDFPELRKPFFECLSFGGDKGKTRLGEGGPHHKPLHAPLFADERYNLDYFYGSRLEVRGEVTAYWDGITEAEEQEVRAVQRVGQSVFPKLTTGLQGAKTPEEVASRAPVMMACNLMTDPLLGKPRRVPGATMIVDVSKPMQAHAHDNPARWSRKQSPDSKAVTFLRTGKWGEVTCPQDEKKSCGRCYLELTYKGPEPKGQ